MAITPKALDELGQPLLTREKTTLSIKPWIAEKAQKIHHDLVEKRHCQQETWLHPEPAAPKRISKDKNGSRRNSFKQVVQEVVEKKRRSPDLSREQSPLLSREQSPLPQNHSLQSSPTFSAEKTPKSSGCDSKDQSPLNPNTNKRHSVRVVKGSKRVNVGSAVHLLRHQLSTATTYMGIDWYTIDEKRHHFSCLFFAQNLYYWCYTCYICVVILLGGFLMWALEPEGHLSLTDAFYTSAACVTQSGLAVVDWSKQSTSTYAVSFCLILLGSASLLHMVPVILRRQSFKKQARLSLLRSQLLHQGTVATGAKKDSPSKQSKLPRKFSGLRTYRRSTSAPVQCVHEGEVDTMEVDSDRESAATDIDDSSLQDMPGQTSTRGCLSEMHRLEYLALEKTLMIMASFWLAAHIVGVLIFWSYFTFKSGPIVEKFHHEGLHPLTHAVYLTVSSFQNNGLVLTPSSVMDFSKSPILLNTIGALIIFGNTGLPIMVRLITTAMHRAAEYGTQHERALGFLLEHPRRCFTHMFPATHTAWLLICMVSLNFLMTTIQICLDHDSKAMNHLSWSDKWVNALFQSISSRTAGLNSVNLADLSQATTFALALMMYLATTPTVVVMRMSASKQELDITGRAEGIEEEAITGDNSLKSQARRYLSQDLTYLAVVLFLICAFEKEQFAKAAKSPSDYSDGIYFDFSFFKVLFELVSAYGTCGLSLGFRNQVMSFSGVWSRPSQMLLVMVMVLGRLRGLPDSIDPSVRVTMEDRHDEEKEHRFIQV